MIGALDTTPARLPQRDTVLQGRTVSIVALDPDAHADALWEAAHGTPELWRYMFDGPYPDRAAFRESLVKKASTKDPLFFAILDNATRKAVGYAAYLRIVPTDRVIEVGSIIFSPLLQQTTGATEAMYLMARHIFEELGYRRYEWKCDAENAPSRSAALRLGYTFEGIFRQHMIIKGKNRDTAWYSMLDGEWPARKAGFERWLDPANFDAAGRQRTPLRTMPPG